MNKSPRHAALEGIMAKVKQGHAMRLKSKLPQSAGEATNAELPPEAKGDDSDEVFRKLKAAAGI